MTIFILIGLSAGSADAYQDDRNICERDAEAASLACETKALHAGFSEAGAAQAVALTEKIRGLNSKIADIRNSQAAQCDNQKDLSDSLAELSEKKAQACLRALEACSNICTVERDIYAREAAALAIVGSREGVELKKSIVAERVASLGTCHGYRSKALEALAQAQSAKKGSHQNAACQSTTSSLKNAANSSERGSQSGDAGSSGCTGPDGRTLDSCRSFKVADGSDEGRRGPGKFKPGGFSDGEWSSQSRDGSAGHLDSSASGRSGGAGAGRSVTASGGVAGSRAGLDSGSLSSSGSAGAGSLSAAQSRSGRLPATADAGGAGNRNASSRGSRGDGELSGNELRELKERNGITGAGGPSIFQKVSRRYQIVRPAMLID